MNGPIWPINILGSGAVSVLPHKATREGQIHQVTSANPISIDLEPGLYLVKAERVDVSAIFSLELATTEPGVPNPIPPGGPPTVLAWYLAADPAAHIAIGQVQQWLAVDRPCTLHTRIVDQPVTVELLIWRAGDCPPQFGGLPVQRRDRTPTV